MTVFNLCFCSCSDSDNFFPYLHLDGRLLGVSDRMLFCSYSLYLWLRHIGNLRDFLTAKRNVKRSCEILMAAQYKAILSLELHRCLAARIEGIALNLVEQ